MAAREDGKVQRSYWVNEKLNGEFDFILADINRRLTNGAKIDKQEGVEALIAMLVDNDVIKKSQFIAKVHSLKNQEAK